MRKAIVILLSLILIGCGDKETLKDVRFRYLYSKNTTVCYSLSNLYYLQGEEVSVNGNGYCTTNGMTIIPCEKLLNVKVDTVE